MATPEEEIRDLKAKIAEYEAKLDAATTEAGEERYAISSLRARRPSTSSFNNNHKHKHKVSNLAVAIPLMPVFSSLTHVHS
jgi:hypothetical protein